MTTFPLLALRQMLRCCHVAGLLLMYRTKEMGGEVEIDIVDRFIRLFFIVINFVLFTLLFLVFFL